MKASAKTAGARSRISRAWIRVTSRCAWRRDDALVGALQRAVVAVETFRHAHHQLGCRFAFQRHASTLAQHPDPAALHALLRNAVHGYLSVVAPRAYRSYLAF